MKLPGGYFGLCFILAVACVSTSAQNLYEVDIGTQGVMQITPGGVITSFAHIASSPNYGIAFDSAGMMYLADLPRGQIDKIDSSGTVTPWITGLNNPKGIAFDSSGTDVAQNAIGIVSEITPGGVVSTFASGLSNPVGLVFDSAGNLYESDAAGGGQINKITPGGIVSTFATGLDTPTFLAFDSAGTLFENDAGSDSINKIDMSGTVTPWVSGLNLPWGIAFDSSGNLYESDAGNDLIQIITPGGSMSTFVTGVLGAGIAFGPVPEPSSIFLFSAD